MRCFISCPKIFNFLCSGPLLPWFILVSECIARATTAGISVRLRSCGPGQLQSGTFLQPSPFSIEQKFTSLLPSFPALPLLTSIPFWTLIARRLRTWLPEDLLVQLAPRAALNKKKKKENRNVLHFWNLSLFRLPMAPTIGKICCVSWMPFNSRLPIIASFPYIHFPYIIFLFSFSGARTAWSRLTGPPGTQGCSLPRSLASWLPSFLDRVFSCEGSVNTHWAAEFGRKWRLCASNARRQL